MPEQFTNNLRKIVKSLGDARHRKETGLFVAEGAKCVFETINSFRCRYLFATQKWIDENKNLAANHDFTVVTSADIERMSQLRSPQPVIAVYETPEIQFCLDDIDGKLVIALDRVQDPGNLGTIMRIADWYGIDTIIASNDTVDVYNPKVVQATMGGIARVKVYYVNLPETLNEISKKMPVYGTSLSGENIYATKLDSKGVIVMGNEGNGISSEVDKCLTHRIFLPSFPENAERVESLNVSMATAVTVAEFRRRMM